MAVPFVNVQHAIGFVGLTAFNQAAGIGAQSHGPSFVGDLSLIGHEVDHGMGGIRIKFRTIRICETKNVPCKFEESGTTKIVLTERGSSFGFNNLVVDMRSLPVMRQLGFPVIFDATHSVQLPGGAGTTSGGQREFIPSLASAAAAAGCDGFFMEVHPDPASALSDGPNMVPLEKLQPLLERLLQITRVAGKGPEISL